MPRLIHRLLKITGIALATLVVVIAGLVAYVTISGNSAADERESIIAVTVAPGQVVTIGDRQIHVRTFGDIAKPTVLLLHGFSAEGGFSWGPLPELLADSCHVLVPDMLGFGHSERVTEPGLHYTHTGRASRMAALLVRLGVDGPVDVVGTSFGGGVAAELALSHPNQVRRLVLIDAQIYELGGGIFQFLGSVPLGIGRALSWYGQGGGSIERERGAAQARCESGGHCPESEDLQKQFSLRLVRGTATALHAMSKTPTDAQVPRDLRLIRSPTLVIWGERDNLIPVSDGERLSNDLSQALLATVEGAGHNPYLDRPEVVAKLVEEFFLDRKD